MDISLSLSALILLAPFLFSIAIIVKIDSKGPALFRQGRLTKDGRVFLMLKFRTMIENAETMGTGLFNFKNDRRVTRVGNLLRQTSLDELPQLLNVLLGDMSIVGPRPPVSYELGNYADLNETYKKRFTVLSGITGLAQISGRNELPWDEKVKFDNQYICQFNKYGILVDLKIMAFTLAQVFTAKDIYEVKDSLPAGCSDEEAALKTKETVIQNARRKVDVK